MLQRFLGETASLAMAPDMARIVRALEVRQDSTLQGRSTAWINHDIVPLPPSRRTWGAWSFVGFWCLTGINISGWTAASALLALGLNVWQALLAVIIGQVAVALVIVGNGFVGAEWHIGFPIYNRFVWGVWGSFFPLLMRIMLSFVWYGVQLWFGGKSVKVVIGAIWPSFYTLHNTLPPSANMELNDFIAFLVFSVISLPFLAVPPEYFRKPFLVGSVIITVTASAIFIWALAKEGGGGPLLSHPSQLSGVTQLEGSALGWAMAYAISATIGGISAGILNQSDYTRFATYPKAQIVSQLVIVPVTNILVALIGIIVTSCAAGFYPNDGLLWAPYDLLTAIQVHEGPGARAVCFFAGCAFILSQLGINIPGNAISGGIDLSGLLPRFITIRRGAYITAAVGVAINPWKLLNGASTFLTVLSSFGVFLGPLTGIMVSDYLIIRKSKLRLTHLYLPRSESIYWFTCGVNLRALTAWVMGVWPLMPGFIASVNKSSVTQGWAHTYDLAWPLGFAISAAIHVLLSTMFPPQGLGEVDEEDVFGTFYDVAKDTRYQVDDGVMKSSEQV